MILRIGNERISTERIKGITITSKAVLVDGVDDFWKINYRDESEIQDAINWKEFQELTRRELRKAVDTIILTCEHYINEKEMCSSCPLQNNRGCILTEIPIEWRS